MSQGCTGFKRPQSTRDAKVCKVDVAIVIQQDIPRLGVQVKNVQVVQLTRYQDALAVLGRICVSALLSKSLS